MKAVGKTLFGSKAAAPRPTRREALEVRPLRNPELQWYEDEGVVVLHIVRAQTRKTKLLSLFVALPDERKIELDAMGSGVWRQCDGQTSLRTIARNLAKEYQLEPREAEISVGQFFINLQKRGFVVLLRGEGTQVEPESAGTPKSADTKQSPGIDKSASATQATAQQAAKQPASTARTKPAGSKRRKKRK